MTHIARRINRAALPGGALLLALLTSATGVAAQTIYRWTDDRGVVHFGHLPPPDRGAQERRLPQRPRAETPAEDAAPAAAPAVEPATEPAGEESAPQPPAESESNVILDNEENALVGASVQRFLGRVKNRGRTVARDVAVDILVFDETQNAECVRSTIAVSPKDLTPGATGIYAVDLQNTCFEGGTRAAVRARWN